MCFRRNVASEQTVSSYPIFLFLLNCFIAASAAAINQVVDREADA